MYSLADVHSLRLDRNMTLIGGQQSNALIKTRYGLEAMSDEDLPITMTTASLIGSTKDLSYSTEGFFDKILDSFKRETLVEKLERFIDEGYVQESDKGKAKYTRLSMNITKGMPLTVSIGDIERFTKTSESYVKTSHSLIPLIEEEVRKAFALVGQLKSDTVTREAAESIVRQCNYDSYETFLKKFMKQTSPLRSGNELYYGEPVLAALTPSILLVGKYQVCYYDTSVSDGSIKYTSPYESLVQPGEHVVGVGNGVGNRQSDRNRDYVLKIPTLEQLSHLEKTTAKYISDLHGCSTCKFGDWAKRHSDAAKNLADTELTGKPNSGRAAVIRVIYYYIDILLYTGIFLLHHYLFALGHMYNFVLGYIADCLREYGRK